MLVCPDCIKIPNINIIDIELSNQVCNDCGGWPYEECEECPNMDCWDGFVVDHYECNNCGGAWYIDDVVEFSEPTVNNEVI